MSKTLIITGGSRGIGEKTIALFLQNNWRVINVSRSPCLINSAINFNIDLSNSRNITSHIQELHMAAGNKSVICLVHNAAYYKKDSVDSLQIEDLQTTLEVSLISPVLLNQIFIPLMLPGSSIIYIGSTLTEIAVPNSASYVISKHAVKGLMKATCQDLAGTEIHTCCINPGLVDTTLLKNTMDENTLKTLLKTKVIGNRLIEPNEIANIIHFCAITPTLNGTTIDANLGQRDI